MRLLPHMFASLLLAALLSTIVVAQRPTASLSIGQVVGTTTRVPGAATPAVKQYLGVPFAQSPPLRFAPPRARAKFAKPYDASKRKPSCVQQFNYPQDARNFSMAVFNNPPPPSESEDCLYLNVFAPASASPKNLKSVMFWIYGGNLNFGYGGLPFYDGSSFAANHDVVVVTINYRTNVFGFPSAPFLKGGEQNPGFLDQRFALTWVSQHVASFGGDPSKITIFGESAGGYSVKQLLALPPKPLTFRGAIMESQAVAPGMTAQVDFQRLAAAVGCSNQQTQLACLRKVPALRLKNVMERQMLSFGPVEDGVTNAGADVTSKVTDGSFAPVPFMIGTNRNEGSAFTVIILLMAGVPVDAIPSNRTAQLNAIFPDDPILAKAIDTAFDPKRSVFSVLSEAITLAIFQCPAKTLANTAAQHGHNVWRYHYAASYANFQPFENAGVFHSAEIPAVFGTFGAAITPNQRQNTISKYMQTEWANFAKTPVIGPRGGWPKLGSQAQDLNQIGGPKNPSGPANITEESIDSLCPLLGGLNIPIPL